MVESTLLQPEPVFILEPSGGTPLTTSYQKLAVTFNQNLETANGSSFTGKIINTPIQRGSVVITVGALTFLDNRLGDLFTSSASSNTGTIDYQTGNITLSFNPSLGEPTAVSFSETYTSIQNPSRIYWVQNLSAVTLVFSQDGVNDHFYLPAGGSRDLNVGSNRGIRDTLAFKQGTPLYVKTLTGSITAGLICLTSFYMTQKNY